MNFLCDRCKQKYHVADEKIRGRAVTRFRCKKCEHVIELRLANGADGADASSEPISSPSSIPPSAATPLRSSVPPARSGAASHSDGNGPNIPPPPRAPTGVGLASAPRPGSSGAALPMRAPGGLGTSSAAAQAPRPATSTGLPVAGRPIARAPTGTGLPIAPRAPTGTALPAARPQAPAPRPATSTGLSTAAARSATAPSPLRSSLGSRLEGSATTSNTSALLNATETGWYAGVRDLPVGPITRGELSARIEAGDITPDSLVWREGLDDWRPLRTVAELSDLVRHAQQRMSNGLLGTMGGRAPSASTGKVVPLAKGRSEGRSGFEEPEEGAVDDEPTRLTSLAELVAKSESPAGMRERRRSSFPPPASATTAPRHAAASPSTPQAPSTAAAAPASPHPSSAMPNAISSSGAAPSVQRAAATAPVAAPSVPVPAASASAGLAAPFIPISPPVPPASANTDIAGAKDAVGGVEPRAPTPYTMGPLGGLAATPNATPADAGSSVATPSEPRPGGLPMGAWIMMAGVGVVGVAVGLLLRPGASAPAAQAPAAPPAAAASDPTPRRTVGADIHVNADSTPTAPNADPIAQTNPAPATTAGSVAPEPGGHRGTGAAGHGASASTASAHSNLSASQLALLNAQLGSQGGGGAPQSTGPTATLRTTSTSSDDSNGGLTGSARAGQVIEALRRSSVVDNCWAAAQRRNPAHPAESLRVTLDVAPNGRASHVLIAGAQDPDLATCIQTRARSTLYGAGGSISAQVSFNLVGGQ